jgi:lipopolysaccharide export system permease protein
MTDGSERSQSNEVKPTTTLLPVDDDGTFLVLANSSVQRHQAGQRDPNIVKFERYAFDLSQFSNPTQSQNLSVRELYLWELLFPSANDPTFKQFPNRYRAELHDRLAAPFYPIAFAAIAFAWLGAPSTTRQSRAMAVTAMILGVFGLRIAGFAGSVIGINSPIALAGQYVALAAAMAASLQMISRGSAFEPPAWLSSWIASLSERVSRRFATS